MVAAHGSYVTPEQYLATERVADEKHTLWNGEVFAMAGALPDHNAIVANVIGELGRLTRRGPCRVFSSDLRVYVPLREGFVYPDVSVVCGPLDYYDATRDVVTNPTLVVEVLSESTEAFDRGEKARGYRALPSLREHLLVSQTERLVEHYARNDDGSWSFREYRSSDVVRLASLGEGELRLDEVYLKVFAEPAQS